MTGKTLLTTLFLSLLSGGPFCRMGLAQSDSPPFQIDGGVFSMAAVAGNGQSYLKIEPFSEASVKIQFSADSDFPPSALERYGFINPRGNVSITAETAGDEIIVTAGVNVITIDTNPFRLRINEDLVTAAPVSDGSFTTATFAASSAEHFFGLGQRFSGLDQTGKKVTEQIRGGVDDEHSLSGTPFFMSTQGYGLLVDTTYQTVFDFTRSGTYSVSTADPDFRYFYIRGPSFKDVLQRYTAITGRPSLPPRWTFGYWQSKFGYSTRAELERVATLMRLLDFPCDALVLDYYWRNNEGLSWYEPRFPGHRGMLRKLKRLGFQVVLHEDTQAIRVYDRLPSAWLYPVTGFESFYGPGEFPIQTFPEVVLDMSHPDATDWYWQDLHVPLLKEGAAAFWLDELDWTPEEGPRAFHDGLLPEAMHNLYPNLFNKTIFENMEVTGRRGAILTRSAWTGSQRYPWVWSGDVSSTFQGMKEQIIAGQAMGLSGFPFWSNDLGGFVSGVEGFFVADDPASVPLKPSDELQIRWSAEFGAFTPMFRVHGMGTEVHESLVGGKEPWSYGPEAQEIFRFYDKLRYQLLPYTYSVAYEATETGLPLMRALVLEFQDDPQTYSQDMEYLFGPAFLVAPVVEPGATTREVYLPAGKWIDYWTNKLLEGPRTIPSAAPLETLPLFVKAGAVIPMGPVMSHTDEKPLDPLTLAVYPVADGAFMLYEDDGATLDYQVEAFTKTPIEVTSSPGSIRIRVGTPMGTLTVEDREYELVVNCIDLPTSIQVGDSAAITAVKYDAAKHRAVISLPKLAVGFEVTIDAGVGCPS